MKAHEILITSRGGTIKIPRQNSRVNGHWDDPSCHADLILKQINEDKIYEPLLQGRENLTILDLGANIGLFSLYVSDISKLVISVEPTPDHFYILGELTRNYTNIQCLNVAVSNSGDDVELFLHTGNSTANSLLKYDPNSSSVTVRGMTVAMIMDFCGTEHIDFCKVDIEGSEEFAITDETIDWASEKVDSWYMEVHPTHFGDYAFNIDHFMSMFKRHGYHARQVTADGFLATRPVS